MRKKISYPFLAVIFFLFFWMNLPKKWVDQLRNLAVAPLASKTQNVDEVNRLQIENQKLKAKLDQACHWLQFEKYLNEQLEIFKEKGFSEKRSTHLKSILMDLASSMPAQVIYRDPNSWSSTLWVNVGKADNRSLGREVIGVNSPVLSEGALVGVVDYVGEKQAKVRLITDSALCPSVRAIRGSIQNRELKKTLQALMDQVENRDDLFLNLLEKQRFLNQLIQLKSQMGNLAEDRYLAKGEIHGSSAPLWRSRGLTLKGTGFNYDYPDEQGEARNLSSSILKEGDFLVTTGLDGVFPPGLFVGIVSKLYPLKRGSYCYDIEVRPAAYHLNDLQTLFILPPQE